MSILARKDEFLQNLYGSDVWNNWGFTFHRWYVRFDPVTKMNIEGAEKLRDFALDIEEKTVKTTAWVLQQLMLDLGHLSKQT